MHCFELKFIDILKFLLVILIFKFWLKWIQILILFSLLWIPLILAFNIFVKLRSTTVFLFWMPLLLLWRWLADYHLLNLFLLVFYLTCILFRHLTRNLLFSILLFLELTEFVPLFSYIVHLYVSFVPKGLKGIGKKELETFFSIEFLDILPRCAYLSDNKKCIIIT